MNRLLEKEPITVKISLSSICNRRCEFCMIHSIDLEDSRKKIPDFMSLDMAEKIAVDIGNWLKHGIRFEFGGTGEPMLNKNVFKIVEIISKHNPKSQLLLYSNLTNININTIKKLFDSGLHILMLDCYEKEDIQFVENELYEEIINGEFNSHIYNYNNKCFNPYRNHRKEDLKAICFCDYTKDGKYNIRTKNLHNNTGFMKDEIYEKYGIEKPSKSLEKMCVRPFRELVISTDGIVPICCLDWHREMVFGKFPEQSLKEIWESDIADAVRLTLLDKNRKFFPCYYCNDISKMVGLVNKPEFKFKEEIERIFYKNKKKYQEYELESKMERNINRDKGLLKWKM